MNRKLIQLLFLILQNPFIGNFLTGRPHTGTTKSFCAPGLHCYSCPSMAFGCPLGVLQYVVKYARMIPYYAIGSIAAVAAFFGSATCGFVCPFGFFQEILHSISPWKNNKAVLPKGFRYIKWGILIVFVILVPALGVAQSFCAWICPTGTIFAGLPLIGVNKGLRASIGVTFYWKIILSTLIVLYVMREKRAFCRYLCPLGLMLGFFNKISLYQIKLNKNKCTTCKACQKSCPMGLDLPKEINSIDCIKCGDCIPSCPAEFSAISKGFTFSDRVEDPKTTLDLKHKQTSRH